MKVYLCFGLVVIISLCSCRREVTKPEGLFIIEGSVRMDWKLQENILVTLYWYDSEGSHGFLWYYYDSCWVDDGTRCFTDENGFYRLVRNSNFFETRYKLECLGEARFGVVWAGTFVENFEL